ncbi:MAG: HAMP domain-containing histidine kinase [Lachnospiraceae bacterium]|nr:HAMP domain-containing histidine kinase [Lachnospiraceae bacterium]
MQKVKEFIRNNFLILLYLFSGILSVLFLSAVWTEGYYRYHSSYGIVTGALLLFMPAAAVCVVSLILLVRNNNRIPVLSGEADRSAVRFTDWIRRRSILVMTLCSILLCIFMIFGWDLMTSLIPRSFLLHLLATVLYGGISLSVVLIYARFMAYCFRSHSFRDHLLINRLLPKKTLPDDGVNKTGTDRPDAPRKGSRTGRFIFWTAYGIITLMQLFVLAVFSERDDIILLFFIYKAAEFLFVLFFLHQLGSVSAFAGELADGGLDRPVPHGIFFPVLKKICASLNSIKDAVNTAVERQVKSEHLKTELITNVSHDLKTPLTSVINYTELLKQEDIRNETAAGYIDVLSRQSEKLRRLTEDLIEASKASTGNLEVDLAPCCLTVMLDQAAGEFRDRFTAAELELIIQAPESGDGGQVMVMADGRHLWRVFDNLMSNICKYAMRGTRVYIDVEQTSDRVSVIFRNISAEPLNIPAETLMQRFVRADPSRSSSSAQGNGLGLSIADSLMKLMGGELIVTIDGDLFKAEARLLPAEE